MPVPVRPTLWGLFAALSAIDTAPLRTPVAAGENVTLIVQWVPGAIFVVQSLVWSKSPGSGRLSRRC